MSPDNSPTAGHTRTQPADGHRAAVEWCYDAVGAVSRTFALTVSDLVEPMAQDICVGYLVCRVADTVEDDPRVPATAKLGLLDAYDRALDPSTSATAADFRDRAASWAPSDPGPDWDVVLHAPRVLTALSGLSPAAQNAIRPPVREMVGGMTAFVDRYADDPGLRIRTIAELEEYCWYAAGTVGTLVTSLAGLGADDERVNGMAASARDFGLLLQLVNVAKDAGSDYTDEDNVYLPATWLADAGVTTADLGDPAAAETVAPVVERLADRAEGYLDGAQAWLSTMPERRGNRLSAWATPYLLAVATLRELRERPADTVREGDVTVSRAEVGAVVSALENAVAADLPGLRARVAARPLQEHQ